MVGPLKNGAWKTIFFPFGAFKRPIFFWDMLVLGRINLMKRLDLPPPQPNPGCCLVVTTRMTFNRYSHHLFFASGNLYNPLLLGGGWVGYIQINYNSITIKSHKRAKLSPIYGVCPLAPCTFAF